MQERRSVRFGRSMLRAYHASIQASIWRVYLFIMRAVGNRDKGLRVEAEEGGRSDCTRVRASTHVKPTPPPRSRVPFRRTRIIKSPKSREIEARKACPFQTRPPIHPAVLSDVSSVVFSRVPWRGSRVYTERVLLGPLPRAAN